MKLILLSGLSNAGKSSFADFLEQKGFATHVPLDKYFLPVPEQTNFLEWVQRPGSIDWELLEVHLDQLAQGKACFTPAYDGWGSGKRLSNGGDESHARSRHMKPSEVCVVPGCLSFEYAGRFPVSSRIFVDTALEVIALRLGMNEDADLNMHEYLVSRLTANYQVILNYRSKADEMFSGESADSVRVEYMDLLSRTLTE